MSTPEAPSRGPCVQWIAAEDVAAVCPADSTAEAAYDDAARAASDVLFELSGRQFPGECERTVRPCEAQRCPPTDPCGCCWVSRILLAGYPVIQVSEVLIDGETVDPSGYRLDAHRWLVRMPDADGLRVAWPGCQRLDLDDTEPDTFAVTYTWGATVPLLGQQAAAELACQLAAVASGGECDLPAGTTKVTRQGITVDLDKFGAALVGLPLTSLFLATYNPSGLRRRPALVTPDLPHYPQSVGS